MELYEEYHKLLKEYKELDKNYDKILEKKARAILNTQPGAVDTSKDNVSGGKKKNPIEVFVEELEKIEPELNKARNDRDLKGYFLKKKELELRESKEVNDRLYVMYYLDNMKVKHIAIKINYSKEQTYRYIREIEEKITMTQNDTKVGL